jgi:excisionase family DNA binding protein
MTDHKLAMGHLSSLARRAASSRSYAYEPIVSALEEIVNTLPLTDCPSLVGELERLKLMAVGRIMSQHCAPYTTQDRDLLTIGEVAKQLKVSKYRAYELARQGLIHSVRLGRSVRVKPAAVADYLARQGA